MMIGVTSTHSLMPYLNLMRTALFIFVKSSSGFWW